MLKMHKLKYNMFIFFRKYENKIMFFNIITWHLFAASPPLPRSLWDQKFLCSCFSCIFCIAKPRMHLLILGCAVEHIWGWELASFLRSLSAATPAQSTEQGQLPPKDDPCWSTPLKDSQPPFHHKYCHLYQQTIQPCHQGKVSALHR